MCLYVIYFVNTMFFRACLLLLIYFLVTSKFMCIGEIDLNFREDIPEGERRYTELLKNAEPYGDCWRKAVSDLHQGCKRLTEEVQSRLAFSFTNCFLKHSGFEAYPCSLDVPISVCLQNSSNRDLVFSTYTEFFTHTQSICHYLQHKEWQEEAANTILLLTETSQVVSKKLDESSRSQSKILDLAQAALYEQKRLISSGRILNTELQRSRDTARNVYNEFKATTNEQRLLLFEVFDRVKNLQNFVLGEFTGVYTVAYYLIAVLLIYISTSVTRTADARIWLILVVSANAALERFLTAHTLEKELTSSNPMSTNGLVFDWIWLCRKMSFLICLIILIVTYYRYKDYNAINNQLLREIQQQNKELQMFLKGMGLPENMKNNILMYSAKATPVSFEDINVKKSAVTLDDMTGKSYRDIHGNKSMVYSPKTSTPETKATVVNFEDKENNLLSPIATAAKKKQVSRSNKQKVERKQRSVINIQDYTPGTSKLEENISAEVQSPRSFRYSLRNSSRLNSPL